jgi:hypothetical protein
VSSDAEVIRYLSDNVSCTSVQPYQWYPEGLCQPSSVPATVCGMSFATSISTQLYVHAPVSAPLLCMWHCRHLYTSASVQINTLSHIPGKFYVSALVVHHPFVLSVLAPSVHASGCICCICIHISCQCTCIFVLGYPILSCLISSDSLYGLYSLYS